MCALQIMHYCIGTKNIPRILCGKYGPILTGTVDSSFASHPDRKGQSCFTLHLGGGGAAIMDTKKQTVTPYSSTESEIDGNMFFLKPLRWARNFMYELGYDQTKYVPLGTPTGEDNLSTMKVLLNPHNCGKTKHLDLRYQAVREAINDYIFQMFHLPSDHMPSDLGTKSLPPGVFQHLSDYVLGHKTLEFFLPFFENY